MYEILSLTYLFLRHKHKVDRPLEGLALLPQPPDSLNVLDADTFHVLRAPPVDVTLGILVSIKWWVGPVLGEHGHYVRVRV